VIEEETVPLGNLDENSENDLVFNEIVPLGAAELPQTGEAGIGLLQWIGTMFMMFGLWLLLKDRKFNRGSAS